MKKAFIYSAIVLLAAGTACNKTDSVLPGDGQIRFALTSPETRALVENDTDLQAQTIKVYDLLDGTNYFDADETVSYSSGAWNFDSGKGYTWKTGSHRFFAYTNGAGNFADNKLTVAKTLTTAEANQVDLVYSNIVSKTAEQAKEDSYMPVSLNMDHLFSAVAITVQNFSGNEVTLNSVSKPAIPNSGSATVDFSGDAVAVTYGDVTADGDFSTATALATTNLAAAVEAAEATGDTPAVEAKDGGKVDVIGQAVTTDPAYYIVWPQALAAEALSVKVKISDRDEVEVKLPAVNWQAGNKYDYILQILPSDIRLKFVVQPWDSGKAGGINTSTGSINMSNVTWMNTKLMVNDELVNTVVNKDFSVTMYKDPYLTVTKYPADVYKTYEEDVYQTYAEDVYDEDGETIIHRAGELVLDENGDPIILHYAGELVLDEDNNPIVLHHARDLILDENGHQVYQKSTQYSGYYPAQGYFTVNYPNSGLFKIELKPAVKDPQGEYFDASKYEILIYDASLASPAFRAINPEGETITINTVYFRITAAENQDGAQHKAQINILFKPTGSEEWISAYSEIRANYACIIPAVN